VQSVTIFSCRIPCAMAGAGKLDAIPAVSEPAPARMSRRLIVVPCLEASGVKPCSSREPAAEQDGAFGDVAPAFDQPEEFLVAPVDLSGKLMAGADLSDDIIANLAMGLQYGVVEFQDFDGAFVAQPLQRQRVVRVELRQRARVFGRRDRLDQPPVGG